MKSPPNHGPLRIFRSLAGDSRPWTLTRTLQSNNPSDLHGELKGTASFRPRPGEDGGSSCLDDLLYAEEGEMPGLGGTGANLRWSRKYLWRFNPTNTEAGWESDGEKKSPETGGTDGEMSVWFVKPTSSSDEADYLFHTLKFHDTGEEQGSTGGRLSSSSAESNAPVPPAAADQNSKTKIVVARGYHLCVKDDYDTIYAFRVADDAAGKVVSWASRHMVSGPSKDQDIVNMYSRREEHGEQR